MCHIIMFNSLFYERDPEYLPIFFCFLVQVGESYEEVPSPSYGSKNSEGTIQPRFRESHPSGTKVRVFGLSARFLHVDTWLGKHWHLYSSKLELNTNCIVALAYMHKLMSSSKAKLSSILHTEHAISVRASAISAKC